MNLSRRWIELLILLVLVVLTTPVFWLTDLDTQVASWFYANGAWQSKDQWLRWVLFEYAGKFINTIAIIALAVAIASFFVSRLLSVRRPALYLFLVILLGSGLVVNLIFKDHWGRPRPIHTQTFGGDYAYVPPLKIGASNDKSFPCGHCSVSFAFFSLYFLARRRKVLFLLLTLVLGAMMGWTRMAVGGHFLSDVLWSGYLVFFVSWLLYYFWYEKNL